MAAAQQWQILTLSPFIYNDSWQNWISNLYDVLQHNFQHDGW